MSVLPVFIEVFVKRESTVIPYLTLYKTDISLRRTLRASHKSARLGES